MQAKRPRYYWVDVAKVIGIFLVYYAHILQRTYRLSTDEIFFQYKLIYAFHLPLFFFISGFFYKRSKYLPITQIGILFQKRIFPVLLFGLISLAIWPIYQLLKFGEIDYQFLLFDSLAYLQGRPGFNPAIWFLVCLFMVEMWAALFIRRVNSALSGILIACSVLYFGYSLTITPEFEDFFLIPRNFWYFHESVVAFGFFVMGYATFNWVRRLVESHPLMRLALLGISIWVTVWSVNMNSPTEDHVVVMKASLHGNYYFFISAFAGTLATILIASFIPRMKWVDYIGRNTLILMGTNGLFMSFFNSHVIHWLNRYESTAWVTFDSFWISILTIGLSVPMIELLNKWVPQLTGKPQTDGPLFRALPPPKFRLVRALYSKLSQTLGNIKDE